MRGYSPGPGTAKTSILKIIERFNEEVLRPQGREHFSINLACTGKAARELSLATGREAFTLDSFRNGNPASNCPATEGLAGGQKKGVTGGAFPYFLRHSLWHGQKKGHSLSRNPLILWLPMLDDIRNFLVSPPADFLAGLRSLRGPASPL